MSMHWEFIPFSLIRCGPFLAQHFLHSINDIFVFHKRAN